MVLNLDTCLAFFAVNGSGRLVDATGQTVPKTKYVCALTPNDKVILKVTRILSNIAVFLVLSRKETWIRE